MFLRQKKRGSKNGESSHKVTNERGLLLFSDAVNMASVGFISTRIQRSEGSFPRENLFFVIFESRQNDSIWNRNLEMNPAAN